MDCCYVLRSLDPNYPRKTYVGVTNNLQRRLYQHNTEGAGGAKRTEIGRPWEMVCYFTNFPDRRTAEQLEWAIHHGGMVRKSYKTKKGKMRKKYTLKSQYKGGGLDKRFQIITEVLLKENFTSNCVPSRCLNLRLIWLVPGYQLAINVPYVSQVPFSSGPSLSSGPPSFFSEPEEKREHLSSFFSSPTFNTPPDLLPLSSNFYQPSHSSSYFF
jgi:predicted GIY-YIG superfamily endonuclease